MSFFNGADTENTELLRQGIQEDSTGVNTQPVGSMEMVRLLIENGADVHAVNRLGETPLHQADASGNEEMIRLLIEEIVRPPLLAEVVPAILPGYTAAKAGNAAGAAVDTTPSIVQRLSSPK